MAKRRRIWNQSTYQRYVKSGRGQGEGSAYLPWISVQDFSSHGMVSRVPGHKTKRVHHFLSRNELYYFYLLEWSEKVLDIREQFPLLEVERAIDIARSAGIKYPRDNISGFPYILTCDFMITTEDGFQARTIKCTSELSNNRTREKLEIERRYWKELDIGWGIVTENEIAMQKVKNIAWLYTAAKLPEYLADQSLKKAIINRIKSNSIQQTADWFEKQYGYPAGSGLRLIKHLLWSRQIVCEMDEDFLTSEKVDWK